MASIDSNSILADTPTVFASSSRWERSILVSIVNQPTKHNPDKTNGVKIDK